MIDWFRGSIPFVHSPINSGHVFSVLPDGSIDWLVAKSHKARGSNESSLQVKSQALNEHGQATELWIDGNLSKYLQGHNLFGSRDLGNLVYLTFLEILNSGVIQYELLQAVSAEQAILTGEYAVKSLDINQLYRLDNDRSVEAWLYAAEMHASKRAGRTTSKRGTVYLGQHSRRWAIKFYNKFQEMLKHQSESHVHYERLLGFAKGMLRVELRLLSQELKDRGLSLGKHFNENIIGQLFNEYVSKIDMNTNATLIDEKLLKVPRAVQATYQLWLSGNSCRELLPHNTFYRHRRILKEFDIDINFPHTNVTRNNVVPLLRVVEAVPAPNPQWAYDLNLIA